MKQTLYKKYVYEGYAFNITVTLNNKESEKSYIHEIITSGKDYFEITECTSDSLADTLKNTESNIIEFINSKLTVSEDENLLKKNGFIRISY